MCPQSVLLNEEFIPYGVELGNSEGRGQYAPECHLLASLASGVICGFPLRSSSFGGQVAASFRHLLEPVGSTGMLTGCEWREQF